MQEITSGNRLDAGPDTFERAIVGCMVQSSEAPYIGGQCDPEVFSNPRNLFVYALLRDRALAKTPLGEGTAAVTIHQSGGSAEHFPTLESVQDYIEECIEVSQPIVSWPEYVKQAQLAFTRRKLLAAFDEASVGTLSATSAENAVSEAIFKVIEAAGELRQSSVVKDRDDMEQVTAEYLEQYLSEKRIIGEYPQQELNQGGGFRKGQVVIICAPTGTGKSWWGLDVLLHNALKSGMSSRIYSLEMDKTDLLDRMIAMQGDADLDDLIEQRVSANIVQQALSKLKRLPISIVDRRITPGKIFADLASIPESQRPSAVLVDHLDLFNWKEGNETNALKSFLAMVKDAAKTYGVTFFLVAQFRRSRSDEEDKNPHMGMLKGGSAIEQIADRVIFLAEEQVHTHHGSDVRVKVWVPKQRQGKRPGRFRVKFLNYRFRSKH